MRRFLLFFLALTPFILLGIYVIYVLSGSGSSKGLWLLLGAVFAYFVGFVVFVLIIGGFLSARKGDGSGAEISAAHNLPGSRRYATQEPPNARKSEAYSKTFSPNQSLASAGRQSLREEDKMALPVKDHFDLLAKSLASAKKIEDEDPASSKNDASGDLEREVLSFSSAEEVNQRLSIRLSDIYSLVEQSHKHLSQVDNYMLKHLTKNTSGSIQATIEIRRILAALQSRAEAIKEFLSNPDNYDVTQADFLLNGELEIGVDSLNALMSEDPIAPLKPSEWRNALSERFMYISRKRSIFKGWKIGTRFRE